MRLDAPQSEVRARVLDHAHHQIRPVGHQVPAYRSARFDLLEDARLGLGERAEPEPGSPQRGRHITTICQGRDSDTDAVFVTRTSEPAVPASANRISP